MKNKLITIILLLTSLSCKYPTAPAELLIAKNNTHVFDTENQTKAYPYWNIGFSSFVVANETVRADLIASTSEAMKYKAKRLEVREKELMLQKLDLIRFVINTKEFEEEIMKSKFRSSRDASGPNGTIKVGDTLNNKRMLEVIKRREYNVSIRKGIITAGAAAVGVVGPSLYVMSDNDKATSNSYWIAFPNHEDWSAGGYLQDNYMAGVVLHEMIHNSGFTHGVDSHDAVYGVQGAFKNVYGKKEFREKYAKELETFRGFYSKKYENWLKAPTVYKANNFSLTENAEKNSETCTLFYDGTYLLE